MFLKEFIDRIKFWKSCDRIGPEIPYTHWRLYFKSTMLKLCKRKFKFFDDTAEFRPFSYAICCSKIHIGKRVVIRPGSLLEADPREGEKGITIEDDVLLGPGVHIFVSDHFFNNSELSIFDQGHGTSEEVVIKKGAWIGANVIILKGVTIGRNSVVGAGSVVTKSIPDFTVAAGNPARILKIIKES